MVSPASLPKMALSVLCGLVVFAHAGIVPESEREINRPGRIVHGEDAEFGKQEAFGLDLLILKHSVGMTEGIQLFRGIKFQGHEYFRLVDLPSVNSDDNF